MVDTKITAVIMAGGKGTRLGNLVHEIPKPMVKINDVPIIERQITDLKNSGIKDLIIVVGYLGDVISSYFKDGKEFGVNITYIKEDEPLGSCGSLYYLKDLVSENFILLFGDLIESVDFNNMLFFHKNKNALITLFAHPNSHPYDSDLVVKNDDDIVLKFDSKHNVRDYYYHNLVNAGIYIINKEALSYFEKPTKLDMEKDFVSTLIKTEKVYAYVSSEYVKDAGTFDRLEAVGNDIKNNIVSNKNLAKKQKAIFLDRDGTINVHKGHLNNVDNFELLPGVSEAIQMINDSDYLAIVITNQPVISRGELTFEGLDNVHKKMETLLGKDKAYLDAIYFCPHYPESGFEGEVKALKIDCDCRKPKIGMLLKAQKRFNINFESSWFVGDSDFDILCGQNAKTKTVLIDVPNKEYKSNPDYRVKSLLEAVKLILRK